MFEDEINMLSPYEAYIIIGTRLKDTYASAFYAYENAKMEIEHKNTKFPDCYLKRTSTYIKSLETDYEVMKILKSDLDEKSLTECQQEQFHAYDDLFQKVEKLLKNLDIFLSQYNVDLTI